MYTELSFDSLQSIAEKLILEKNHILQTKLDNFLQTKYDEYYVYDKKIFESHVIEITVSELECIIATFDKNETSKVFDDLCRIHKIINRKSWSSIFLYGGNRT